MKKIYLNILGVLAISGLATSQAWARIYLQNDSKAQIQYHMLRKTEADNYRSFAKILENGNRVEIYRPYRTTPLSVCRIDDSSFTDLSYLFDQMDKEKGYNIGKDAIILITPGTIYGWKANLIWEKVE